MPPLWLLFSPILTSIFGLVFSLAPRAPTAFLKVNTPQYGASIWIDERLQGRAPLPKFELKSGFHIVRLSGSYGRSVTRVVWLKGGQSLTVRLTLPTLEETERSRLASTESLPPPQLSLSPKLPSSLDRAQKIILHTLGVSFIEPTDESLKGTADTSLASQAQLKIFISSTLSLDLIGLSLNDLDPRRTPIIADRQTDAHSLWLQRGMLSWVPRLGGLSPQLTLKAGRDLIEVGPLSIYSDHVQLTYRLPISSLNERSNRSHLRLRLIAGALDRAYELSIAERDSSFLHRSWGEGSVGYFSRLGSFQSEVSGGVALWRARSSALDQRGHLWMKWSLSDSTHPVEEPNSLWRLGVIRGVGADPMYLPSLVGSKASRMRAFSIKGALCLEESLCALRETSLLSRGRWVPLEGLLAGMKLSFEGAFIRPTPLLALRLPWVAWPQAYSGARRWVEMGLSPQLAIDRRSRRPNISRWSGGLRYKLSDGAPVWLKSDPIASHSTEDLYRWQRATVYLETHRSIRQKFTFSSRFAASYWVLSSEARALFSGDKTREIRRGGPLDALSWSWGTRLSWSDLPITLAPIIGQGGLWGWRLDELRGGVSLSGGGDETRWRLACERPFTYPQTLIPVARLWSCSLSASLELHPNSSPASLSSSDSVYGHE